MSLCSIAEEVGCSHSGINVMLRGKQSRVVKAESWTTRRGNLTAQDREKIILGLHRGESMSAIARQLGRVPSTVTREVSANGGRDACRVWPAHLRARRVRLRPKPAKLDHGLLCETVAKWLKQFWSPEEIRARLVMEFLHDPNMRVSHETIYQSLFVQGRGELRRELTRCLLRSERTTRRTHGTNNRSGLIEKMTLISQRPAEPNNRIIPRHWAGDLISGKGEPSALHTLV
jgi:IS30 family transposase